MACTSSRALLVHHSRFDPPSHMPRSHLGQSPTYLATQQTWPSCPCPPLSPVPNGKKLVASSLPPSLRAELHTTPLPTTPPGPLQRETGCARGTAVDAAEASLQEAAGGRPGWRPLGGSSHSAPEVGTTGEGAERG